MKFAETINGYNAMGRENAEYEACYAVAEHHTISGLHCHDFYEFYIHYQGGKVYQAGSLWLQFQMHPHFLYNQEGYFQTQ